MNAVRTVALVLGVVYVLTGIAGFVPSLVTGGPPPDMPSASGSLFGVFPINTLHNLVHIVIGAVLLYGATGTPVAVLVARVVGVVYAAVGLLGFVAPNTFGLMPIGGADIGLHLVTAAILLYIGFAGREEAAERRGTVVNR
jgi:hypothetical protein